MKRFFTLAGILAATALLSTSCKDTTKPGPDPTVGGGEVSFTSAITRATDTQFESGDEISVTALKGADFVAENVKYAYAADKFTSSTPIEIEEGEKFAYRAVYPFMSVGQDGALSFEVLADQSAGTAYTESDLMSSFVEETASTTPKLVFDHLLSKVIINVVSSDVAIDGASASIEAKRAVDFNILTNACLASGDASAITMAEDGAAAFKAVVAPQSFDANTVFCTLTIGSESYELVFDEAKEFKSGKEYEFDLTIAGGAVSFDEDINDWEDGNLDEPDVPTTDNEIQSITIVENEYKSLIIDVDVADDFTDTYALFAISASQYEAFGGDVEKYAVEFIAEDIATYGTDYTVADDMYVFQGDLDDFNFSTAWNLNANVDFYILGVGADANGELTTAVTLSELFTVKGSVDPSEVVFPDTDFGTIEEVSTNVTSFVFDVEPADEEMGYVVFAMTTEMYNSYDTDADRFIADLTYLESLLAQYGYTLEDGLSLILTKGDKLNEEYTGLDPDTEYTIYAYGIDPTAIQPMCQIETLKIATTAPVAPEGELGSISVSDATSDNAIATIDAGDYTGNYYVMPITLELLNGEYGGSKEAALTEMLTAEVDYYGTDLSTVDDVWVFNGDSECELGYGWNLEPATDYLALAVGVDVTGAMTTAIIEAPFSTTAAEGGESGGSDLPTSVTIPDVEFGSIEFVSAGSDTYSVNVTPNDKEMSYIFFSAEKSFFDTFATEEDLILDDLGFINYYAEYYGYSYAEMLDQFVAVGDLAPAVLENQDSETEYVCYAYGIDMATSQPLTKVTKLEVATTAASGAPAQNAMAFGTKEVRTAIFDMSRFSVAKHELRVNASVNRAASILSERSFMNVEKQLQGASLIKAAVMRKNF